MSHDKVVRIFIMRACTETAIFDSVMHHEIAAAPATQQVKRTITEKTVVQCLIYTLMAGKVLTLLMGEFFKLLHLQVGRWPWHKVPLLSRQPPSSRSW